MKIPGTRNWHRWLIYGGLALLVTLGGGSLYEVPSDQFAGLAKSFLESICDRRVEIGSASFNLLGRVRLNDVKIYNRPGYASEVFLEAPRVYLTMGMSGGETSAFRPQRIVVDEPVVHYERPESRPWNTEDFWRQKTPRHDHPTFTLPVTIRDAAIHYTDSAIGRHGVSLVFSGADIDLTVISDGTEIRNLLTARDVPSPGGGVFDFLMQSHPNAKRAEITIAFREADIVPLKPFQEFFTLLETKSGRVNGSYQLSFDNDTVITRAEIALSGASLVHPPTGTVFPDVAPRVSYESIGRDSVVTFSNLRIEWKKSLVTGEGSFSARHRAPRFTDLSFRVENGRAEDLSFLLCDPSFTAQGPISGSCRIRSEKPGGADVYEVEADLGRAAARYGGFIAKDSDVAGRLSLRGRSGARPELVRIGLGSSTVALRSAPRGWALELESLTGEDAARFLVPLAARREFRIAGPVTGRLLLPGQGAINGTIDLTSASTSYGTVFAKQPGDEAMVDLSLTTTTGGAAVKNSAIRLGGSRLSVEGTWSGPSSDIALSMINMKWSDARHYLPAISDRLGGRLRLEGEASGRLRFASEGADRAPLVEVALDLDRSTVEIAGVGKKVAGYASNLKIAGRDENGTWRIDRGELSVQNTRVEVSGEFAREGFHIAMKSPATGLTGLATLLSSQFWNGLRQIDVEGEGRLEIDLTSRGEETRIAAELDARDAMIVFGDTWVKPIGEAFGIRTRLSKTTQGTQIERFEIAQGSSTLLFQGRLGAGQPAPLDVDARANLDVPGFLKHAPGLSRTRVEGRRADEALQLIASDDGRASFNGKLSGTLEEPRLSLVMDQVMTRIIVNSISRQIRALSRIVTIPMRLGQEVLEATLETDSGARTRERR